jgi:c-di-GMP-binding flagellar brake protein YcgR
MHIASLTTWLFGQDTPLSRAGTLGATVLVLLGLGMAAWVAHYLWRRQAVRRGFRRTARADGFDKDEAESLWALAKYVPEEDRKDIATSRVVFEECVRRAAIAAGDFLLEWPELLTESRLSSLRRHYIVKRRTPASIADTRQIESNQPVTLHVADGGRLGGFVLPSKSSTLRVSVANKTHPVRVGMDQPIRVTFARPQDARYEFSSEVIDEGAHAVDLRHAPVNRIQQRARVRVKCQDEIEWTTNAGAGSAPRKRAMLRDLSGGGACFVASEKLDSQSRAAVSLCRAPDAEPVVIQATIVRQVLLEGTSQPMYQTSVRFEPLDPRHEYYLSRMVSDLQQRLIRRMLARSGEPEEAEEDAASAHVPRSIPVRTADANVAVPGREAEVTDLAPARAER